MDNAKSIIDIEVNDDQFKEFHRLFQKYHETLGTLPAAWKKVNSATDEATNVTKRQGDAEKDVVNTTTKVTKEKDKQVEVIHKITTIERETVRVEQDRSGIMQDMTASLMAHLSLMEKSAQAREDAEKAERLAEKARDEANKRLEASEARQNALLEKRQKYIKELSGNLSSVIGKTASIGLNVAKWGAGVGLAMIGGGFFGMDRLGASATADRSTSRGLGVSAGQLRAWRTDFAPYGNPDALLGAASNAYSDPMMRATLQRAGVGADVIRSGNTSQIAEQTLRGLTDFYNRNQGPNAQQIWQSRGFNDVIGFNDMRQFAAAPASEREAMFNRLHSDAGGMGNNDNTLRQWQDFTVQLERAKQQIKATFLDGLAGLTGPMSELSRSIQNVVHQFMSSGAFSDLIKVLSQGINDLADSFKDGSAQKGIKDFIGALSQWAKDGTLTDDLRTIEAGIHKLAGLLGWIAPGNNKTPEGRAQQSRHRVVDHAVGGGAIGAAIGAVAGSIIPGAGTIAGGFIGGTIGSGIGAMLGGVQDASASGYHAQTADQQSGLYRLAKMQGADDATAHYLAAIAATESRGNPHAMSSAGAMGLMQLMPSVAKQYGVKNPFDQIQSMRGGAALVHDLIRQFHGDMTKVTAAYNAGGGRVQSAISKYGEQHWLEHMPQETQQYVGRVAANIKSGGINVTVNNNTGGAATVTARQAAL